MTDGRRLGEAGERIAAEYLRLGGYSIMDHNWRSGPLEIDIVAARDNCVAFVEVKTRRSRLFGRALESVDGRKRRNMRRAAGRWLAARGAEGWREVRCDLVAIDADEDGLTLRHLRGIV